MRCEKNKPGYSAKDSTEAIAMVFMSIDNIRNMAFIRFYEDGRMESTDFSGKGANTGPSKGTYKLNEKTRILTTNIDGSVDDTNVIYVNGRLIITDTKENTVMEWRK